MTTQQALGPSAPPRTSSVPTAPASSFCRCGHGRGTHRRAAQLSGWERGRGQTAPRPGAWVPCQAYTGPRAKCPCRNYVTNPATAPKGGTR